MIFQDSLKANYRDIDEVNKERRSQRELELFSKAKETIANVKNKMLRSVRNGECKIIDGEIIVAVSEYLPPEFFQCREDNIPAKYGRTLFGRVVTVEPEVPQKHFEVKPEFKNDYDLYLSYITDIGNEEGIVAKCVYTQNKDNSHRHEIPYTQTCWYSGPVWGWHYFIEFEAKIPDKYANDKPIDVVIHTEDTNKPTNDVSISIDAMEGHDFEHFCAAILRKIGYTVEVTPGSGDQGIDVIAIKDEIKYGIQCKCYSSDIGNKAVQEAFAGKTFYKCHIGVVLTNRYFTRAAKELAEANGIVLWNRDMLLSFIDRANSK